MINVDNLFLIIIEIISIIPINFYESCQKHLYNLRHLIYLKTCLDLSGDTPMCCDMLVENTVIV
jgi:hypothetical protein